MMMRQPLLICFFISISVLKGSGNSFTDADDHDEFVLKSHLYSLQENSWDDQSPILLWWTKRIFSYRDTKSVSKITCKSGKCLTTVNRDYLMSNRTRGLLFYGTDISVNDLPLPRQSWHEWALFHEESPLNNYKLCHQSFLRLFNHTATCRRESDFPLTLQWVPDNNYLTSRKPLPTYIKNQIQETEKLASVLYIQSHCEVPSDRDRYVKELMKHIQIDSFGKCLKNKKWKKLFVDPVNNLNNPRFLDFIARYKFHIAFENAYLEDYMTEKLMRAYHVGSVPIYKGAPNARDWIPSDKSTVFVDDFESPEHLANFLKYLNDNDDEYDAYLNYKTKGITNNFLLNSLHSREWRRDDVNYPNMLQSYECHVCDEIIKRLKSEQHSGSVPSKFASHSHFGCKQPYPLLIPPDEIPSNDSWRRIDWINMYWRAFDESLAVNSMIQAKEIDSSKFEQYLKNIYTRRRGG